MIKNTYPSGRVNIINGDSGVILMPDHRIYYVYYGADDMDYCYDLLSHIGEFWIKEINEIIAEYEIQISMFEDSCNYYNVWVDFIGANKPWVSIEDQINQEKNNG